MEKTIEFTHEDRARLARLYEEAAGRLYEAALLISRNVGLKGEVTGFQFDHSRKVRTQTEPEAAAQGNSSRSGIGALCHSRSQSLRNCRQRMRLL